MSIFMSIANITLKLSVDFENDAMIPQQPGVGALHIHLDTPFQNVGNGESYS